MNFIIKLFADDPGRFNSFRFSSLSTLSTEALVIMLLAVAGAFVLSLLSLYGLSSAAKKHTLILLRFFALAVIALIIIEPAVTLEERQPLKGKIALLVDNSLSLNARATKDKTRFETGLAWLKKNAQAVNRLTRNFDIETALFGKSVKKISLAELITNKKALKPNETQTLIAKAIAETFEDDTEKRLAGVIVLTDGIDSALKPGETVDKRVLEELAEKEAPVFFVDTASGSDIIDVSVSEVRADDFVYIRNTTEVDVVVTSYN